MARRGSAVRECVAAVEHVHVGQEVQIAGLSCESELGGSGNLLNGVQGLHLLGREGGKVGLTGVRDRTKKRGSAKIELHHPVLVEDDWTALVTRESEWPVAGSEDPDQVRAGCRQNVVDRTRRGDDTAATSLGGGASEPGHDIGSFFCVVRLQTDGQKRR